MFKRDGCVKSFTRKDCLARHNNTHVNMRLTCDKICSTVQIPEKTLSQDTENIFMVCI